MREKCVIFGASQYGDIAQQLLKEKYDIIGFVDNDFKKWGSEFCGKKICSPDELAKMNNVQIMIASQYYFDINRQLYNMGLRNIKVFYYCGNIKDSVINNEYKLYSITNKYLFEDCVFDKGKISKIRENFSENYELTQKVEKIELKETSRKKVLFCAYIFPPLGGSGVQRSLKFVKYLKKFGYDPIVLTVGQHNHEIDEDWQLFDEIKDVQIIRIDDTNFLPAVLTQEEQQEIFNLYAGIVRKEEWMKDYIKVISSGHNWKLIPDNRICWVNECLKQIESKLDLKEIDIVYTTGAPFSTYILGYYLKNKYGMKWVQDYRDPWGANDYYIEKYYQNDRLTMCLQQELEKSLILESDAIVVAAEGMIDDFVEKYSINKEKIVEITNGYDEDDFKNIVVSKAKNKKFTLCHNGSLYGDRTPLNLLKAVNNLIEKQDILEDEITWLFNGTIENRWRQQIDESDKYNIVQYNGYLSHMESIKVAMSADALILFGFDDEGAKIGYTGKIFEYIRMGKNILGFSGKDGVIENILKKTKAGANFEYEDVMNVENYILNLYKKWRNAECKICVNRNEIEKYSRENTTKMLSKVFSKLLGEK